MFINIFVLAVIVAIASADLSADRAAQYTEDAKVQKSKFEAFKRLHQKGYSTQDEENKAFVHFVKQLKLVDKRNAREAKIGSEVVHGINQYADMSQEDFETKILSARSTGLQAAVPSAVTGNLRTADHGVNNTHLSTHAQVGIQALKDWTQLPSASRPLVSPVKNQYKCGSCWAYAGAEQLESDHYRYKPSATRYIMAAKQMLECAGYDYGCGGGPANAGLVYAQSNGMCNENYYVSSVNYQTCGTPCVAGSCWPSSGDINCMKLKAGEIGYGYGEAAMAAYVQSTGPVITTMNFRTLATYASSATYVDSACSAICGTVGANNHVVQIVGVDTTAAVPYWKIRNSYGTGWGSNGYFKIKYGSGLCCLGNEAFAYLKSVTVL